METPWRKSLCKVVSKGEGSLEDLEPDGSTKSNLWSDAPFMSFTTLSRIVRGGVMLLQSRAVRHDRTVPTDRPSVINSNGNMKELERKMKCEKVDVSIGYLILPLQMLTSEV